MTKISFIAAVGLMVVCIISCKPEGCTDDAATNYDSKAKKNDGSCVYETTYQVPTTYSFERNGSSSVSFEGQTARMDMLEELATYMKSANKPGIGLNPQIMFDMFSNSNAPFSDASLNNSTKQLKNKTAGGDATVTVVFEDYMDRLAAISARTSPSNFDGRNGVDGVVQSGSKQYLLDTSGVEYAQFIEKGLMGSVFYHQIQTVYLGEDKMNVDNEALVDGKNYTTMEHHWDEAFGYFTDAIDFPLSGTDRFWGKYCDARDADLGCNATIMNAFLKGRAAVTNKDIETRNTQIAIIRNELQKVVIASAISYFKEAKSNLPNDAIRNHSLSEAVTFVNAIQYSFLPALSDAERNSLITSIGDNFYNVKSTDIDLVIADLNTKLIAL